MMLPCAVSGHSTESIPGMIHHSNDTSCGENSMTYPIVDALMLEVVSSTQNDKAGEFWIFGKDTVRNVNNAIDRLIKENLVLDVCNVPFGSKPNALWRRYSLWLRPHFRARPAICCFCFSVTRISIRACRVSLLAGIASFLITWCPWRAAPSRGLGGCAP